MRINHRGLLLLLAAACMIGTRYVRAEDGGRSLLDQALENTEEKNKNEESRKPIRTPSPDAARTVDNDDLTRKLTGEEKTPATSGPDMTAIVTRMKQSTDRLKQQDGGDVTQEIQHRIVLDLDALIELARNQQNNNQSQQQQPSQPGQKTQQNPGQNSAGQQQAHGNQAANNSQLPGGGVAAPQSNGQDIRQRSSEWGNLPPRERDLIVNGAKEEALPSYKELVQRYYQALSELNRTQREER